MSFEVFFVDRVIFDLFPVYFFFVWVARKVVELAMCVVDPFDVPVEHSRVPEPLEFVGVFVQTFVFSEVLLEVTQRHVGVGRGDLDLLFDQSFVFPQFLQTRFLVGLVLLDPMLNIIPRHIEAVVLQEGHLQWVGLDHDSETLLLVRLLTIDVLVVIASQLVLYMHENPQDSFSDILDYIFSSGSLEQQIVDTHSQHKHPTVWVNQPFVPLHHLGKEVDLLIHMHRLFAHRFYCCTELLVLIQRLISHTSATCSLVEEADCFRPVFVLVCFTCQFLHHLFYPSSIVRKSTFTLLCRRRNHLVEFVARCTVR